jgi:small subunit ribosomal protein S12
MMAKPFRSCLCLGVKTLSPKKPNSANRSVALIRFNGGKTSSAYIPGISHTIQQYNALLVRGGRTKDLPGMKLKVVRGGLDAKPVKGRVSSRSKYGQGVVKVLEKNIVYLREANKLKQLGA